MPHLVLARPAWDPGDAIIVTRIAEAAEIVAPERFSRVFLTTGRSGVSAFAGNDAWFLIRAVTAPDPSLPRRHQLLLSRGPYHYDDEHALLREHRIDALVTKNSGGDMTRPKLDAAAALGVAVVMMDRPPLPAGVAAVGTVPRRRPGSAARVRPRGEHPVTPYHWVCDDPTISRQRMSTSAGSRSPSRTTRTSSRGPDTSRPITTGVPGSRCSSSRSRIAATCQVRDFDAGL